MRSRATLAVMALAIGIVAMNAGPATAAERLVDDNLAECPKADFTSIQAAVTAAAPGDKVKVCPGTYTEQVRIESKDKLKLEAKNTLQATIQFPPATALPNALVLIRDSDDVEVTGFVISGPYTSGGCVAGPAVHRGVFVDNSLDAKIKDNHVTLIRDINPALYGCQDGLSVQVGRQAEASVSTAEVKYNLIDEYQKGGVVVDNAGSVAKVEKNQILAALVVQPFIAPNGVQISRGAGGEVKKNEVSQNKFGGNPAFGSGTGVLVFSAGAGLVKVEDNDVFDNDDGISLFDTDLSKISHNDSHDNVIFDGLYADVDSQGNEFKDNKAFNNAEHDCHDDSVGAETAGTANTWKGNKGTTQTPAGICKP